MEEAGIICIDSSLLAFDIKVVMMVMMLMLKTKDIDLYDGDAGDDGYDKNTSSSMETFAFSSTSSTWMRKPTL